jgi:hypothetical protein
MTNTERRRKARLKKQRIEQEYQRNLKETLANVASQELPKKRSYTVCENAECEWCMRSSDIHTLASTVRDDAYFKGKEDLSRELFPPGKLERVKPDFSPLAELLRALANMLPT